MARKKNNSMSNKETATENIQETKALSVKAEDTQQDIEKRLKEHYIKRLEEDIFRFIGYANSKTNTYSFMLVKQFLYNKYSLTNDEINRWWPEFDIVSIRGDLRIFLDDVVNIDFIQSRIPVFFQIGHKFIAEILADYIYDRYYSKLKKK